NARFLPDKPTEAKAENRPQLLNAYDNTILHTDRILARLIGILRTRHCISAVLYTSDHGENIFDDSRHLFLHASPRPSEYDTDVPLLVWTSEQFGRQYPQVVNAMRSNLRKGAESNASVFPTMLSIAGIRARACADSLSLTNRTYRLGTRYYLDDHNHAVPLSTFLK
ncbi:MAG: sulfatase-like hydrolase/transferase, partial [Prevotella sp.]